MLNHNIPSFHRQPVGDELLVFDQETGECRLFSPPARFIVDNGDDPDLVDRFRTAFPEHAEHAEALVEGVRSADLGRRTVLKIAGVALITSLASPRPAAAASLVLTLLSATYSGPDAVNCPGPNAGAGAADPATLLTCLQSIQTPTSLTTVTLPGTCSSGAGGRLGVPDPAVGTRKSLIINYQCSGGPVQQNITCDGDPVSIVCP